MENEKKTLEIIKILGVYFGGYLLDKKKICWKYINNKWIGKRSVWTFDNRACWLEDTEIENVKYWWCGGKNSNYLEVFENIDSEFNTINF